jgi:methylated-DNA-[protein]-cysteine S-methyltransferase
MYFFCYHFPLCELGIAEDNGSICHVFFKGRKKREICEEKETPLIKEAAKQLKEYFGYKRKTFDLPLAPRGTEFQKKVWDALLNIPYGETRGYGEIAKIIGNPKACRAVGMANNRNPIVIIIPCHRVIGADGSLTGFGSGLDLKIRLLELEAKKKLFTCAEPQARLMK